MIIKGRQTEKAYRLLLRDIEAGLFPVNSSLPAGVVLCEQYGVSHPTMRKAVAVLARESRLIVKQGSGTYVAPPPALRNGATRVVSIMAIFEDPCLKVLQSLLLKDGYLMNVYLQGGVEWSATEEGKFLKTVKEQKSAALLAFCSPRSPTHEALLRELKNSGVRVIHYEHYRMQLPEQEYLLPDYDRAGHMAAVKLLLAGYKQLYLVGR